MTREPLASWLRRIRRKLERALAIVEAREPVQAPDAAPAEGADDMVLGSVLDDQGTPFVSINKLDRR